MTIKSKYIYNYQLWRIADHLFGNTTPAERFIKKRQKNRDLLLKDLKKYKGSIQQIEKIKDISDNDLKQNYIKRGIPVVLKGKAKNGKQSKNGVQIGYLIIFVMTKYHYLILLLKKIILLIIR